MSPKCLRTVAAVRALFFLCFIHVFGLLEAFNLDVDLPVMKRGNPESYFGFSVAEHQTVRGDDKTSWLLVGAPLDQNLQPNTSKSGALWKCPLTMNMNDCVQVVTDGKIALESNVLRPPNSNEIKNHQWLGVSVKSQGVGGKVVVCAHRYIKVKGESHFGFGLCYTLTESLNYSSHVEPCKGRPTKLEHEEFGYCQAGTSSTLLEDGTLILGSPGPHTWRGTIFIIDTSEDFLKRDQHVYLAPYSQTTSPVDKYSYLGMAVTGAKFFGKEVSFAAGAPRSNSTGQVLFFSKDRTSPNSILKTNLIINGEQFASNFGYEIATADLNGDGKPDLIVGAPFYFSKNIGGSVYVYINNNYFFSNKYSVKLTGKIESRFGFAISNAGDLNKDGCDDLAIGSPYENDGVVYIYLGSKIDGLDSEPKQIIKGESLPVPLKTFGYSLSGGIDLDGNDYPDLLVGAFDTNAVVLHRARPIIDIKTSIKHPETLKNIDSSKRGCLRDQNSNYTCFSFEICCSVEFLKYSSLDFLKLNYKIEAETFSGDKKFSRVFFNHLNNDAKSNKLNENIILTKSNFMKCPEHVVYIKENTRDIQTPIKFKVNYVIVQNKTKWISSGSLTSIDNFPILNVTQATLNFEGTLLRDCGNDDICESDLNINANLILPEEGDGYVLVLGQENELKLEIKVGNEGESAYEAQLFVVHHRGLNYIGANTDKHVFCKVHNTTMVICSLGNPFKTRLAKVNPIMLRFDPKSLEDHESSIDFIMWANSTSQEIEPNKKPTQMFARVVKYAELTIKGSARPEQIFYGGEVKGESAMVHLEDIGSPITHIYQVFNLGPWRVNSVDVDIEWPHQIANNKAQGKWLFYLDREPTVEEGHGVCKVSPYLNPLDLKPRPVSKNIPENLVDPVFNTGIAEHTEEKSNYSSQRKPYSSLRQKRDVEMIVKPEAYVDKDGNRKEIVNMNCIMKTAKCIKIRCTIYKLSENEQATIRIHGRLWNSSLVEDYPNVQYVSISSRASLSFQKSHNIQQKKIDDDIAIVSTKAYPDLVIIGPANFMWWIILAIILGILVLIGLILLLWKLGFFKRKKHDFTLSGNLEKREDSPFLSKSN